MSKVNMKNLRKKTTEIVMQILVVVLGVWLAFQADHFRNQQEFNDFYNTIRWRIFEELNPTYEQLKKDRESLTLLAERLYYVLIAESADSLNSENKDFDISRPLFPQTAWQIVLGSQHAAELSRKDAKLLSLVSRVYELSQMYEEIYSELAVAHSSLSPYALSDRQLFTHKHLVLPVYAHLKTLIEIQNDLGNQIALVLKEDKTD